jgi:nucleoside phosphorylase
LTSFEDRRFGNHQSPALTNGEGGAPEHTGPQTRQPGQIDLGDEAARGSIDHGHDFDDTAGDGAVETIDLNRNALSDPDETYLPAAETVDGDAGLGAVLQDELSDLGLPVSTGTVWTTDAPYRETNEQLEWHARNGILAVEMQAASLFAFGAARGVACGVVADVTNGAEHFSADQFNKGTHELGFEILRAMSRAGRRCLKDC